MEKTEQRYPQSDQQEQPVFVSIPYNQLEQIFVRLQLGNNLLICLPDQHPYFQQNDNNSHIAATANIGVMLVFDFIFV